MRIVVCSRWLVVSKRKITKCFIFLLYLFFTSCEEKKEKFVLKTEIQNEAIDISEVKTNLPEAEGKALVERHCITCHSLKYIEMQPKLSEKVWQKTIDKMIKGFHAPIPDSAAKIILNYLILTKGKK